MDNAQNTVDPGNRAGKGSNVEVLVVEDSPVQAKVLKYFLEKSGYRVAVAENGEEGLKYLKKARPALVISDIKMPVIDGYEMCRMIKRDPELGGLPVILLTVLSDQKDLIRGLDAGADNYITKPYDDKYLLSIAESLISPDRQERIRETTEGLEVVIAGEKHVITSERKEILNLLLSTYENAIQQNRILNQTELALEALNEQLEERVRERTAELSAEVIERKRVELELRKLTTAIDHSINLVLVTDKAGGIEYVNPKFEGVTGYRAEEAQGSTLELLVHEGPGEEYDELWNTVKGGETWRGLLRCRKKNGDIFWVNCVVEPIKNDSGEITNFLSVQEDITEERMSFERAEYLANYDPATGLLNRTRFISELDNWTQHTRTSRNSCALLLVNLDQFKFINDTFGHATGDDLLRSIAKLLEHACVEWARAKGTAPGRDVVLSRVAGDEFAVLLPNHTAGEGIEAAETLRKSIEYFRPAEMSCRLTASVGVVIYPEHGLTSRELLTRADGALLRAKEYGRNRTHLYRPEDRDLENMHLRLAWKERILRALEEDRFEPWFQPILDLNENEVRHYEVLARMRDEDGTVLLPGKFIEVAERFGIIARIDSVIAEKAMAIQAAAERRGKKLSCSFNISGKNLGNHAFMSALGDKISRARTDPSNLIFEITETAAVQDIESAIRFVSTLRGLGCSFSLDDFGVGFTSFVYLKKLKVDYVKIDGSFIRRLDEDREDQLFVKAITEVAKGMGIKTIAEFVERKETLDLIKKYNVDYGQGFLFGKPMSAIELMNS